MVKMKKNNGEEAVQTAQSSETPVEKKKVSKKKTVKKAAPKSHKAKSETVTVRFSKHVEMKMGKVTYVSAPKAEMVKVFVEQVIVPVEQKDGLVSMVKESYGDDAVLE